MGTPTSTHQKSPKQILPEIQLWRGGSGVAVVVALLLAREPGVALKRSETDLKLIQVIQIFKHEASFLN